MPITSSFSCRFPAVLYLISLPFADIYAEMFTDDDRFHISRDFISICLSGLHRQRADTLTRRYDCTKYRCLLMAPPAFELRALMLIINADTTPAISRCLLSRLMMPFPDFLPFRVIIFIDAFVRFQFLLISRLIALA